MMKSKESIFFSGRSFSKEDIELIKEIASMYKKLSRRELANTICELLGWVQPNGKPKTIQCQQFLHRLVEEGTLNLPAVNEKVKINFSSNKNKMQKKDLSWIDMSEVTTVGPLALEIVSPGERLKQWRLYMSTYHRLGDPKVFGSQLRYIIKTDAGRDLGCLLFSASSWSLKPRDEWIGWEAEKKKQHLHLIVNQSRFLIFPWVRVKNLASQSLSKASRMIQEDWLSAYCYAPVLLETFVDLSFYKGTCYKASNWIYLGDSKGRGRNDRYTERALTKKAIYMYPLDRDFRAILMGDKPWKAVAPHV